MIEYREEKISRQEFDRLLESTRPYINFEIDADEIWEQAQNTDHQIISIEDGLILTVVFISEREINNRKIAEIVYALSGDDAKGSRSHIFTTRGQLSPVLKKLGYEAIGGPFIPGANMIYAASRESSDTSHKIVDIDANTKYYIQEFRDAPTTEDN